MSSGLNHSDETGSPVPRAMIHQTILETAEANPDASIEKLADEVSGASVDLVERVLEKYGDPGSPDQPESEQNTAEQELEGSTEQQTNPPASTSETEVETINSANKASETAPNQSDNSATTEGDKDAQDVADGDSEEESEEESRSFEGDSEFAVPFDVTEKQRQVLQAIVENPGATQHELAESLGVSQSTISSRLNSVPKFEWESRREFVTMMEDDKEPETGTYESLSHPHDQLSSHIEELSEQIQQLDQQLGNEADSSAFTDPDLAHKVLRACMSSENITEEEERRIMKSMITGNDQK